MLIRHRGRAPQIDPSAYVAPNAVVCGDVRIGPGVRVLFGVTLVAEGGSIAIGPQSILMPNALLQASRQYPTSIGARVLVGPHTNISGATIEDDVFIATGVCVFNGARVGTRSSLRINSVVHIKTTVAPDTTVPVGWVAIGEPPQLLAPDRLEEFNAAITALGFSQTVFGVPRVAGEPLMPKIAARYAAGLAAHFTDEILT